MAKDRRGDPPFKTPGNEAASQPRPRFTSPAEAGQVLQQAYGVLDWIALVTTLLPIVSSLLGSCGQKVSSSEAFAQIKAGSFSARVALNKAWQQVAPDYQAATGMSLTGAAGNTARSQFTTWLQGLTEAEFNCLTSHDSAPVFQDWGW